MRLYEIFEDDIYFDGYLIENQILAEGRIKDFFKNQWKKIRSKQQFFSVVKNMALKYKLPLALVLSIAVASCVGAGAQKSNMQAQPQTQPQTSIQQPKIEPAKIEQIPQAVIPSKHEMDHFVKQNSHNTEHHDEAYVKNTYFPNEIITDAAIAGLIVATITTGGFLDPVLLAIGVNRFGLSIFQILAARGITLSIDTLADAADHGTPLKDISEFAKEHWEDFKTIVELGEHLLG